MGAPITPKPLTNCRRMLGYIPPVSPKAPFTITVDTKHPGGTIIPTVTVVLRVMQDFLYQPLHP